jgi:hypothetical protein
MSIGTTPKTLWENGSSMQNSRKSSFGISVAVILIIATVIGARQLRADDSRHQQVVVVGSPKSVKFLDSASGLLSNGEMRIANEYVVVLERVRKIAGNGNVPSRLSLKLLASHAENIPKGALISVVLEVGGGTFEVKYWDVVRQTTCMPRELVKDAPPAEGIDVFIVGSDKGCMAFDIGH